MRSHGIADFPDPVNGRFGFTLKSGIDPDTPRFKAAYTYCGTRYLGFSTRSTPAQRAKWHADAVKFSRCMRAHGVSDFPDPDGTGAIHVATAVYMQTPEVARGRQACSSLLTGKGVVFVSPVP